MATRFFIYVVLLFAQLGANAMPWGAWRKNRRNCEFQARNIALVESRNSMGLRRGDLRRLPNVERLQRYQTDWLSAQLTAIEYTLHTDHAENPQFSLDALIVQHLFERAREYHDGSLEHRVKDFEPENVRRRRWFFGYNNGASPAQRFAELVNRYGLHDEKTFTATLTNWTRIDEFINDLLFKVEVDDVDDDDIDAQLLAHFEEYFGPKVRDVLLRIDESSDAYRLPYMMQIKARAHGLHRQQVLSSAQLSEEILRPIVQLPVNGTGYERIAYSNAPTQISPVNFSIVVEGLIHRGAAPVVTLEWNDEEFDPATAIYKTSRDLQLRETKPHTFAIVGLSRTLLGRVNGFFAQASEGPSFGDTGLFFIDTRSLNLRTHEVSALLPNN